jgi:hypothetical protein
MVLTPDSYPTLAALTVNAVLGLYVLLRGPRQPANRSFAILMGMLVASGAATLVQKNAPSLEAANFLLRFQIFFLASMVAPIVHFAAVFPQNRPPTPRNLLLLYAAVLAPAGLLLFLVESPFRIVLSAAAPSGFSVRTAQSIGTPSIALGAWLGLLTAYAILRVFRTFRAGGEAERAQIRWVAAGLLVTAAAGPFFGLVLPQAASVDAQGAGSVVMMVPALFATVAIVRYRFLAIEPVAEKPPEERPPPAQASVVLKEEPPRPLEPGALYLGPPDRARRAFIHRVNGGAHGICFSRTHPNLLRRELGLEKTPMVWLSASAEADVMALERPDEVRRTLRNFVSRSPGAVVMLDGVEYLVLRFGLDETARLVNDLSDLMVLKGAVLLLPVDPKGLGEREMALLGRHARKLE